MQALRTTLLTGPYDWDPDLLPRRAFEARVDAVRAVLAAENAAGLIVHGNSGDYGALAYLTAFVPKLGPSLAFMPREGALRVLTEGTDLMLPWAKRLTWVEDVRTLANVAVIADEWLREIAPQGNVTLATWGGGAMPHIIASGIARAVAAAKGKIVAMDGPLDAVRRRKSPLERRLMGDAAAILDRVVAAFLAAAKQGNGNRSAALAAERAAYAAGAQDVRVAASLHPGGPPLPIDGGEDLPLDPLLADIAVQWSGYWAEGLVTATSRPGPALARTEAALAATLDSARARDTGAALLQAAIAALAPCVPHALMQGGIGNAIGLSLEEGRLGAADKLTEGGVYVLRVGAQGDAADAAGVSAMIAIDGAVAEILWRTPGSATA